VQNHNAKQRATKHKSSMSWYLVVNNVVVTVVDTMTVWPTVEVLRDTLHVWSIGQHIQWPPCASLPTAQQNICKRPKETISLCCTDVCKQLNAEGFHKKTLPVSKSRISYKPTAFLRSSWASSDTVSCTFSYHTWPFIIFTIFTITACIFSYSFSLSLWT